MEPADYEGLQVNYDAYDTGPEHIAYDTGPEYIAHDKSSPEAHPCSTSQVHQHSGKEGRSICGLSRAQFIALVILLVVAVAAGVGGGVGGALGGRKLFSSNDGTASSTSTSVGTTATPATSSPESSASPTNQRIGSYNCPADNNTIYRSSSTRPLLFLRLCDLDYPAGSEGVGRGVVVDLRATNTTSLEACIDQCAFDFLNLSNCTAVTYSASTILATDRSSRGNCLLKDQLAKLPVRDGNRQFQSAFLVDLSGLKYLPNLHR